MVEFDKGYFIECCENAGWEVLIYDTIHSTNKVIKDIAENGGKEGTVCLALGQTGGRGRMGRSFFSPIGSGIYLSVLLRPCLLPVKANLLTTCAAVAGVEAIENTFGIKTNIKWVNDIYYNNKKIAGILTEGAVDMESGLLKYAVVGIGINVYSPQEGFPADIENKAGALIDREPDKGERERLAFEFVKCFFELYQKLDDGVLYRLYRERMFLCGRTVDVISGCGANVERARVIGVAPDFSLHVAYDDGREEYLSDGEVSLII